jgi:hypothetical protein
MRVYYAASEEDGLLGCVLYEHDVSNWVIGIAQILDLCTNISSLANDRLVG